MIRRDDRESFIEGEKIGRIGRKRALTVELVEAVIIVKRVQVLFEQKKFKVISDNPRYDAFEADQGRITINVRVIWYAREMVK
jgi:hypothetical protein